MAVAPALLPELLAILRGEEYGGALRRRALSILHTVLEVLQVGPLDVCGGRTGMGCRQRCRLFESPRAGTLASASCRIHRRHVQSRCILA
jgi:hypothetical protein